MRTMYKVAGAALLAALLSSSLFLNHTYRSKVDNLTEKLQGVTTELTEQREQHDSFIRQQSLIQDIVAAGRMSKQSSSEEVEHVLKERGTHTPVVPEPDDAERLRAYSDSVRQRASNRPY